MSDCVSIIRDNEAHFVTVVLNRPEKLNAVNMAMFEALGSAADEIATDPSIRAVVLHGAGDNFCAGIDLSVLGDTQMDFDVALKSPVSPSPANLFQRAAYAWKELPIPVICAIEGVAFGAGLQIALGADIRFASPLSRLSIMEAKWGIVPDMGISVTLRNLMSADRAKELAWSARIVDGAEALDLGLISGVVDNPIDHSKAMAASLAERSPEAVRGIKRLFDEGWNAPVEEALALEANLQSGIIGGRNQIEAVQANIQKRAPNFKD